MTASEAAEAARLAAGDIARLTGRPTYQVAVVLGSGWAPAATAIGPDDGHDIGYESLTGFAAPSANGHAGRLRAVECAGVPTLVFMGRTHLYEGRGVRAVAHLVRAAAAAGAHTVILTNAAGGLRRSWTPGTPVLVSDHINLTGVSPLEGAEFVDLTDLYARRLRDCCRRVMPGIAEGVYVQFAGPQYETPAEVRMAKRMGGRLVGMSTALEAIAARAVGLEVLAISLVTNPAAGVSPEPLDHADVLAAGERAAPQLGALVASVISQIGRQE